MAEAKHNKRGGITLKLSWDEARKLVSVLDANKRFLQTHHIVGRNVLVTDGPILEALRPVVESQP